MNSDNLEALKKAKILRKNYGVNIRVISADVEASKNTSSVNQSFASCDESDDLLIRDLQGDDNVIPEETSESEAARSPGA